MSSKKQKPKQVPAVYKPIMLNLPTPTSPEHFMMLVTLTNALNKAEFMRHWRWEKKLIKWLPIMEVKEVPAQHPLPITLGPGARDNVVGPN